MGTHGHHHGHDFFANRQNYFLKPSANVRGAIVFLVLIGIVTLVAAILKVEASRIWGSMLVSTFFLFSIALGGIAFSGMQDAIGAVWSRPIKRIHEAFSTFLPIAGAILAFFLLCILFNQLHARDTYIWMRNPDMVAHIFGKGTWLQVNCFVFRNLGAIAVILGVACWQLRLTARRDRVFADGDQAAAGELALKARDTLRYWCSPVLIVYALCYSLLCFDLIMSLAPLWFSTLFAGWFFAIMMQTLMATILLFLFALKSTPVGQIYQRQQFHDVGKMMHGFTIFFGYLTYAHVLTYWYGNVPEETEYFIERLRAPWIWFVYITPLLAFVLPLFALLGKISKWTGAIAIPLSLIIITTQWFVYILVVVPQIGDGHQWNAMLFLIDFGIFLGLVGLFLSSFFMFAKKYPMVGLADPLLSAGHH